MRAQTIARLGIALGVILAVITMVLVRSAILAAHQVARQVPMTTEVVAAIPVAVDAPLSAVDLTTRQVATQDAPPDVISQTSKAVGQVTEVALVPGEPVLSVMLYAAAQEAGITAELPKGLRAVELPVSSQSGVGTALQPGDRVDVLTVQSSGGGPHASILLSDVSVLGLVSGSTTTTIPGQDTSGYSGVVLELSDRQAAALLLANDVGSTELVLRGASDTGPVGAVTVTEPQLSGEVQR